VNTALFESQVTQQVTESGLETTIKTSIYTVINTNIKHTSAKSIITVIEFNYQ